MPGALLWTRAYRLIGMDPADFEKEEPRTEFSPMKLVYGRRILPVSKRVEDGIFPTDNTKTQTLSARIRKSLSDEHGHGHESLDCK